MNIRLFIIMGVILTILYGIYYLIKTIGLLDFTTYSLIAVTLFLLTNYTFIILTRSKT